MSINIIVCSQAGGL